MSLSIYIPHPGITAEKTPAYSSRQDIEGISLYKQHEIPGLFLPETIRIEGKYNQYFAWHSPCLFFMENKSLKNVYGDIYQTIADDFINFPGLYFSKDQSLKKLIIKINHFQLESDDTCLKNQVSVIMDVDTIVELTNTDGKLVFNYKYADTVFSRVTDLYIISIIGTIPVMIHSGFRGNRQDQLNALGKNALEGYTNKLKSVLSAEEEKPEPPAFLSGKLPPGQQ